MKRDEFGREETADQGLSVASEPDQLTKPDCSYAVSNWKKDSLLVEVEVATSRTAVGWGWEGGWRPQETVAATRPVRALSAESPAPQVVDGLIERARALRTDLVDRVGLDADEVAVQLSHARVGEAKRDTYTSIRRTICAAQVALGGHGHFSPWGRVALLPEGVRRWPTGWIDAFERWRLCAGLGLAPTLADRSFAEITARGSGVLDVFAASELLRIEAQRWLQLQYAGRLAPGVRVAGPGFRVEDPGFFHPAEGVDCDARGVPAEPFTAIADGCWREGPFDGEGRAIAPSWKRPARPGWRSLRVFAPELSRSVVTCGASWLVSRIVSIGGVLLGAGLSYDAGEVTGRWGPVTLPDPPSWMRSIDGELLGRVADGSGLPVELAPWHLPARPN